MFGFSKFDCKFETERLQKALLKMETGLQFKTDWKQPLGGECEHNSFSFLSGCTIGTFEPQCWENT